ncbi:MAG TPA: cellulase family glycosylhydrolase [Limnochordia bacterium]|nr:cellulase family glycosylhydrolase [Limnochordia bacterium]
MSWQYRMLVVFAAALAVLAFIDSPVFAADMEKTHEEVFTMQEFVSAWHPGWNLGNTFDATGSETSWGNPPTTKELIDYIAAAGFRSIRIPVTWGHHMGPAPDYQISPGFLDRIEEVVQWALEAGLYVMLNMHHDSLWIGKMAQDPTVLPKFTAAWEQISARFRDYPHRLIFEGLNEPRFSDDWNEDRPQYFQFVDELNTTFHRIVRASGGLNETRPLVLSTLTGSSAQPRLNELAKTIAKLNDDRIIATVHYYGYWPFSVNIAGSTRFDRQAQNDVDASLNRAYSTFAAKGIPVIIGEYGLLGFDKHYNTIQRGEIYKYFEYVTYYARSKGMPLMIWDNGQHLDRTTLEWHDPTLAKLATAAARSSTANHDTIYLRAGRELADKSITLNLNGNELEGVELNGQKLDPQTDYSLSGSTLTFKRELLERIITYEYGINAILTLKFSQGVDWEQKVVYYDRPVLFDSIGTAGHFIIPAKFNGDQLATMEAVYVSGGNAGPQSWTAFKEFGHCFQPKYDTGVIVITPEFFNETRDGTIRLKFHFWSGEIVECSIVKSGFTISGTAQH